MNKQHQAIAPIDKLRPELQIVLNCLRTSSRESTPHRWCEIPTASVDWPSVVAETFEHHVETFVYNRLKLAEPGTVPAHWLEALQERVRKARAMAFLFSTELLRINSIFETAGVPLIPYKGPALAALAFQDMMVRRFVDLDFFTPQDQIALAAELLRGAGFEHRREGPDEPAAHANYVPGQYAFFREASRTNVELHTECTLRYFPVPLDFSRMSRRLIRVEVCGQSVPTFSVEDTLVMLSVHGAKHFWERLGWLLDVKELIANQPVDWPKAMGIAAKLKSTRLLLLGVSLAGELLDAPVPEDILRQGRQDTNVRWLASKVLANLASGGSATGGVLSRAAFRFRSRDSIADGVRHTARLATMPTESGWGGSRSPGALAALPRLARPWQLIRDYGIGLGSAPRKAR